MANNENGGMGEGGRNALFAQNKWKVVVWFYCAYSNQSNLMRHSLSLCLWAKRLCVFMQSYKQNRSGQMFFFITLVIVYL